MNERAMTRTALTIYLEQTDPMALPPSPILIDEHFFVRSGLDRDGARLIGFSPTGQISITVWGRDVMTNPESVRDLQANFLIAGRVWRHPLRTAEVTIRKTTGVIQVVITGPTGKRYRPYLGDDPDVAERIANSWGAQPGYIATVNTIRPATA